LSAWSIQAIARNAGIGCSGRGLLVFQEIILSTRCYEGHKRCADRNVPWLRSRTRFHVGNMTAPERKVARVLVDRSHSRRGNGHWL
jgi:hypothetical protein